MDMLQQFKLKYDMQKWHKFNSTDEPTNIFRNIVKRSKYESNW